MANWIETCFKRGYLSRDILSTWLFGSRHSSNLEIWIEVFFQPEYLDQGLIATWRIGSRPSFNMVI